MFLPLTVKYDGINSQWLTMVIVAQSN